MCLLQNVKFIDKGVYALGIIRVTRTIAIGESEIQERFVHASGPGGQNVNKVATAVQLRFDVGHSPALSDDVRARLAALAGRRITEEGVLVIDARRFRSQARNRDDALARLTELIRKAAEKPKPHFKTRPTAASKTRRLEAKRQRGETKRHRSVAGDSEE